MLLLLGWLLVVALAGPGSADRPDRDWSEALTLVDRLAWTLSDAEVRRLADRSTRPDALFARSWRAGMEDQRKRLDGAPIYAVEARLEEGALLGLRQAVVWTNRSRAPVDHLVLRVLPAEERGGLHGVEVYVDGRPATWGLHRSLLEIRLDRPVPPGGRARVLITVDSVRIPAFDPFDSRAPTVINALDTGAFGMAEGVMNLGYWLPLVTPLGPDGSFDRRKVPRNGEHAWFEPALFHVLLDVPERMVVASTGVEVDRRASGGRVAMQLVASGVREFAVEASADFAITETEVDGLTLRVFHRADEPSVGLDLLGYAADSLRFFESQWGPLPYREIDVVDAPVRIALGLEFPQLVTVATRHRPGRYRPSEEHQHTVAHEIAHQWWYSEVGNDPYAEPWVDEALAAHAAALFAEASDGREAVQRRHRRDAVGPYNQLVGEGVAVLPADLEAGRYDLRQYSLLIYGKAPLFLEEVRQTVGDAAYHAALRRYYGRFRLRNATGADLLDALRGATREPAAIDRLYRLWMDEVHHYDVLLPDP